MLQYYEKQHVKEEDNHQNDFFMSKLGYYRDTGPYYCYNSEPDLNYEEPVRNSWLCACRDRKIL